MRVGEGAVRMAGERGYESLKNLMKAGNEVCNEISKSLQESTVAHALEQLALQINLESEAHKHLANTLVKDVSIPLKNWADAQLKARKPIEDCLNSRFKAWKDQKEIDKKYRGRSYEKTKEIELLYSKLDEAPKSSKSVAKDGSK
ncbi:unnamed protein product, partial [Didymodactylos carnosus]